MLQLASLSRAFGSLCVIDRLDFTVEPGEILGILGPNGAGKIDVVQSCRRRVAAKCRPHLFEGRDITAMKRWDRCRIGIGRTYQVPKPFTHMTVFENVLVAAVHGGEVPLRTRQTEAAAVLERIGLAHRARSSGRSTRPCSTETTRIGEGAGDQAKAAVARRDRRRIDRGGDRNAARDHPRGPRSTASPSSGSSMSCRRCVGW